MQAVHTLVFIALLTIACNNAYPYSFERAFLPRNFPVHYARTNVIRRDDYDPYGFNSILSRFHKRSEVPDVNENISSFVNQPQSPSI